MMEIRLIDTGKVMAVEISKILLYHRKKEHKMPKRDASKNRDTLFRNVKVTTRRILNYLINSKRLALGARESCFIMMMILLLYSAIL